MLILVVAVFNMVLLVTLFSVVLVSYAYLTFDEELLVILSTLLWFDSAGNLFKKMLEVELVAKVEGIRVRFIWFLTLKQQLLVELLRLHKSRFFLHSALSLVNSIFLVTLVNHVVSLFLSILLLRRNFLADSFLDSFGNSIYYDSLAVELSDSFVLGKFSNITLTPEELRNSSAARFTTYLSPVFA